MTGRTWTDARVRELESAISKGSWHRALRLLESAERAGASGATSASPEADREIAGRMERIVDRVMTRRALATEELENLRGTRRHVASQAGAAGTSHRVDRRV